MKRSFWCISWLVHSFVKELLYGCSRLAWNIKVRLETGVQGCSKNKKELQGIIKNNNNTREAKQATIDRIKTSTHISEKKWSHLVCELVLELSF